MDEAFQLHLGVYIQDSSTNASPYQHVSNQGLEVDFKLFMLEAIVFSDLNPTFTTF